MMKQEKSCGCIIVDNQKILLIYVKDDDGNIFWGFPKGHQEEGETDFETAIRETKEETNLDVEIIDEKPIMANHIINNGMTNKQILLFISKLTTKNQQIKNQEGEVDGAKWLDFNEVDKYLNHSFNTYQRPWQELKQRLGLII